MLNDKLSSIYDYLQITIKPPGQFLNSKKLEIYSISGIIEYSKNIKDCYPKQEIIKKDLDDFFNIEGIYNTGKHPMDESNKSTWKRYEYYLNDNYYPLIRLTCYDMSNKIEKQGFTDQLQVIVSSFEFVDFINKQNKIIMKIILIVLILFLMTSTKAENIFELEIEGISIGDSALDHLSRV